MLCPTQRQYGSVVAWWSSDVGSLSAGVRAHATAIYYFIVLFFHIISCNIEHKKYLNSEIWLDKLILFYLTYYLRRMIIAFKIKPNL